MATDFDVEATGWDTPEKVDRARALAAEIVRRVPVRQEWTALDVGAGTGLLGRELGHHVRRIVLTDTSAGMLDAARAATADDPGRYVTRQIDLTRDPLGERVDLVVSAMALHHIPDTGAILAAIRDALNPGGWVALADLDADPENHFHSDDHDGHRGIDRDDLCRRLRDLEQ